MIEGKSGVGRWGMAAVVLALAMAAVFIAGPNLRAADGGQGRIRIVVAGLRSNSGRVVCTLFHSPDGFPRDDSRAQSISVPIVNRVGTCDFAASQHGHYAAVVYHDENGDGKFNTNWMGLPLEGYGFSNNASISWRPPYFDEASFEFDGGTQQQVIHIRY